jgi:predicted DNA-binding transcriptional regulator AlpA
MAQLTTVQAAKMLGIAPATLSDWRLRNYGPAYTKTGRLIRYPDYEVERWIRENTNRTIFITRQNASTIGAQTEERRMALSDQVARGGVFRPHRFIGRVKKC